ncbi:hypothetical protein [Pseudonocardia kunmingensis]|uniref:hypothetical protein n=1 Tax=Pseudonocardia kunmingensis TaxID=630975 RepID=UPI001B8804BB|nr:hypothetical protein [Pseudonocardia kunmingensis]
MPEPPLPEEITAAGLDAEVRRDLRGLQRDTAESVARHLVAAGRLVDEDPELALAHARFARNKASRIAVVREAAGIAAYHAGEWAEALGELRAARRMGGGPGHLAVMADIERALGRPERALELSRGPEVRELDRAEAIELAIVAAGARRDLGELGAAVVGLQIPELDAARRDPWSARLFYAYADNLAAAGREADALQWFVHAADADENGETDADRRIAELTGEPLPEDDIAFGIEEDLPAEAGSEVADPQAESPDDRGPGGPDAGGEGDAREHPAEDATDARDADPSVSPADAATGSAPAAAPADADPETPDGDGASELGSISEADDARADQDVPGAEAEGDADAEAFADAGSGSASETGGDVDADADAGTGGEAEAESGAEPTAASEAGTGNGADTHTARAAVDSAEPDAADAGAAAAGSEDLTAADVPADGVDSPAGPDAEGSDTEGSDTEDSDTEGPGR